jgi:SNF2 family DNA or RNA helicase
VEAIVHSKLNRPFQKVHGDNDDLRNQDLEEEKDDGILKETTPTGDRQAWLAVFKRMPEGDLLSSRVIAVIEVYHRILRDNPTARIIIFSKFLKFLDIIEEALLRKSGSTAYTLRFDGTKDAEERELIKSRFNNAKGSVVLMITPGAGGAGLNLASGEHVIRCEPWWNGNDERQADCRLYRQGQKKIVFVWAVVAVNSSIDILVERIRDAKTKTIEEILRPLRRLPKDPLVIPRIAKHY